VKIAVRYFAALREALGTQEVVHVADGTTLGALRDQLVASSARHAESLGRGRALRCSVGLALAAESTVLEDGAEVAFFPPVTGG
jgi:molybdopterin synthase sulfur carrier subunit